MRAGRTEVGLLVVLLVFSLCTEGTSQECVNGLLNAESVRQLGRVAGKLKDDRDKQQRIIPDISFTCTGTVTRWIVAGEWRNKDKMPEVQIWRETNNGSGIYTKIHGTALPLSSSDESEIYSITADSVDFQPGDVLGLFEPKNTWLRFYYNDKYGPLNYYINTGNDATPPTDDFDISNADESANDMPLVSVEINSIDGSSVSDCIRNFATMDAIVAGMEESVRDEHKEQRVIPGIKFTCHGFITKWIIAAKWDDDDNYPELQTWNSTDDITYTKQGDTTFIVEGGSEEMTYYEYIPDPPHEFNDGDVLGIFVPDKPRFELFYDRVDSAPLNYIDDTGKDVIPPTYDFTIGTTDNSDQNEVPLVAVEVSIPPPQSSQVSAALSTSVGLASSIAESPSVTVRTTASSSLNYRDVTSTEGLELSTTVMLPTQSSQASASLSTSVSLFAESPSVTVRSTAGSSLNHPVVASTEGLEPSTPVMLPSQSSHASAALSTSATQVVSTVRSPSVMVSDTDTFTSNHPNMDVTTTEGMGPRTTSFMQVTKESSSRIDMGVPTAVTPQTSISSSPVPSSPRDTTMKTSSSSMNMIDSSSSSSDSSGSAAGIAMGILALILLAIIVMVIIAVVVVRKKKRKYDLRQIQGTNGMINPVYEGRIAKEAVRFTKEGDTTVINNALYGLSGADTLVYEDLDTSMYSELTDTYTEPTTKVPVKAGGCFVPTEDQRKMYGETDSIYASISEADGEGKRFFEESNIYWVPASNQSELYEQLASKRFREIQRQCVRLTDRLGKGNFGEVDKGVWESPGGPIEVAVKTLGPKARETEKVKFLQEAAIMGQFHHPNVVTLHGVVTVGEPVMIVLELMPNGDLRQYLMKLQPTPGELLLSNTNQMCLDLCHQTAYGMEYLASKAFVHRDLAARNILLSNERVCKIADFGMARDLHEEDYYVSHGGQIPVKWTAPEALHYKKYSTASDVWSYGALMYEIWSLGHKPFEGYTNQQTVSMVIGGCRLPPPPGCPRALYQLMIHCWHPEAGSRPSFPDLVRSLSRPETELLKWTEEDTQTHPQAAVLGGPLDAGRDLYPDLQGVYMNKQ